MHSSTRLEPLAARRPAPEPDAQRCSLAGAAGAAVLSLARAVTAGAPRSHSRGRAARRAFSRRAAWRRQPGQRCLRTYGYGPAIDHATLVLVVVIEKAAQRGF